MISLFLRLSLSFSHPKQNEKEFSMGGLAMLKVLSRIPTKLAKKMHELAFKEQFYSTTYMSIFTYVHMYVLLLVALTKTQI